MQPLMQELLGAPESGPDPVIDVPVPIDGQIGQPPGFVLEVNEPEPVLSAQPASSTSMLKLTE